VEDSLKTPAAELLRKNCGYDKGFPLHSTKNAIMTQMDFPKRSLAFFEFFDSFPFGFFLQQIQRGYHVVLTYQIQCGFNETLISARQPAELFPGGSCE
jgi:hypothetical protein